MQFRRTIPAMGRIPAAEYGVTLGDFFFPVFLGERLGARLQGLALAIAGALVVSAAAQVVIAVPGTPVPITGQTFGVLLFVFLLFEWIGLSYYMRGEFYRLKHQTFTQAAQALGAGPIRILYRHILPNAMVPVITLFPFMLIGGISSLTALDFLGFGLPPPTPSWGEMLQQGLKYLYAPWLAISSVTALFTTLLLASFVGEGARAAFDPRSSNAIR